jgi:hypothetical protein
MDYHAASANQGRDVNSEKIMKYYKTLKGALNDLCLDTGFNPFLSGGIRSQSGRVHKRATKAALADLGYVVDPIMAQRKEEAAAERERQLAEAYRRHEEQQKANAEYDRRVREHKEKIGQAVCAAITAGRMTAQDRVRPSWTDNYDTIILDRIDSNGRKLPTVRYERGQIK